MGRPRVVESVHCAPIKFRSRCARLIAQQAPYAWDASFALQHAVCAQATNPLRCRAERMRSCATTGAAALRARCHIYPLPLGVKLVRRCLLPAATYTPWQSALHYYCSMLWCCSIPRAHVCLEQPLPAATEPCCVDQPSLTKGIWLCCCRDSRCRQRLQQTHLAHAPSHLPWQDCLPLIHMHTHHVYTITGPWYAGSRAKKGGIPCLSVLLLIGPPASHHHLLCYGHAVHGGHGAGRLANAFEEKDGWVSAPT